MAVWQKEAQAFTRLGFFFCPAASQFKQLLQRGTAIAKLTEKKQPAAGASGPSKSCMK
jgi:hypothetical protein